MVILKKNIPISWIGSQIEPAANACSRLKHEIKCYGKCFYGSLTLNCGDFVFVLNADAKDPDSIEGCDVAQIVVMYELVDEYSPLISEPFRAIVQWYSRPQAIPAKHYDSDEISIDFDREVIEEHRPYDNDISIETIRNKCVVIRGSVEDCAESLLKKKHSKALSFVCRYKFAKKLLPLEELKTINKTISSQKKCESIKKLTCKRKSTDTPKSSRRNLSYTYETDYDSTKEGDVLNYSIVNKNEYENNLNIKLRVSQKYTNRFVNKEKAKENINFFDCTENYNREETDPLSLLSPKNDTNNPKLESTPTRKVSITRRKSILKTPGDINSAPGTPKRNIQLSNIVEERFYDKTISPITSSCRLLKSPKIHNSAKNHELTPCKRKKINVNSIEHTISNRASLHDRRKSDLQIIRENLHVSAIPECLPCREIEFENIYNFIEHKITSGTGGCMYISGVPGTGKTATVTRVIKALKLKSQTEEIPSFEFIDINGMRLTEPRQAYVQIYKQLTGKSLPWEQSHSLLEKRFITAAPRRTTTVLLVDELDILCNRRQDVVYNLLDWPSKSTAKLIVITIANTMDLPERLLLGKVTSRLGLTRLTFQPYTHKQLQEIVTSRIIGSDTFKNDAVQLVARKVAAVSGDARRALDICRRATEIAEENEKSKTVLVNMFHVQKALEEMISSAKVQAIKFCSKQEKIFLQAISAEVTRTGLEEVVFNGVYTQIEAITAFMGFRSPSVSQSFKICSKLGSQRLIICEHSRNDIYQKIILNVSTDDIHFALQNNF